jgi:lysozyme family protein
VDKFKDILNEVVAVEGGYANHPSDPGGETMYGITLRVARANGYSGLMRDLSRQKAMEIYFGEYIKAPKFDRVFDIYPKLAKELIDTGVNAGVGRAAKFLQIALNSLNSRGRHYPNIAEDGQLGNGSFDALTKYAARRGKEGEDVLRKACDVLQGAHYMNLAKNDSKFEDFLYGWLRTRIG